MDLVWGVVALTVATFTVLLVVRRVVAAHLAECRSRSVGPSSHLAADGLSQPSPAHDREEPGRARQSVSAAM
ncbi:MAG: hypothetical protein P4L86_24855 [Mycobacterium sp.]|nr:hypothetical protein [Mycobacterium sp.]